jgi:hypothetical protein
MELIKKYLHTIYLAGIAFDVTENICTKYITLVSSPTVRIYQITE